MNRREQAYSNWCYKCSESFNLLYERCKFLLQQLNPRGLHGWERLNFPSLYILQTYSNKCLPPEVVLLVSGRIAIKLRKFVIEIQQNEVLLRIQGQVLRRYVHYDMKNY